MLTSTKKYSLFYIVISHLFLAPIIYAQSTSIVDEFTTIENWSGETYTLGNPATGWFEIDNQEFLKLNVEGGSKRRFVSAIYNEKNILASIYDSLSWTLTFKHNFLVSKSLQSTNHSRLILAQNHIFYSQSDSLLYLEISNKLTFVLEVNNEKRILGEVDTVLNDNQWYTVRVKKEEGNWDLYFDSNESPLLSFNNFNFPFLGYFSGIQSTFTSASRGQHFYYDYFEHEIRYKEKDRLSPVVASVQTPSIDTLTVSFDETIASSLCEGEVLIDGIKVENTFSSDSTQIIIENTFEVDSSYKVTISGFCDLHQNYLIDTTFSILIEDHFPPEIDTVLVIDEYQIEILFNEAVQNLSPNDIYIVNKSDTIFIKKRLESNSDSIQKMILLSPLKENKESKIIIENLSDISNNYIDVSYPFFFDTKAPKLIDASIISSHQVELVFNEQIFLVSNIQVIMGENSIEYDSLQFLQNDTLHLLYPIATFQQDSIYQFEITGIKDRSGNELTLKELNLKYDIIPPYIEGYTQTGSFINILWNEKVIAIDSISNLPYNQQCASYKTKINLEELVGDSLTFKNVLDENNNTTPYINFYKDSLIRRSEAFFSSDSTIRIYAIIDSLNLETKDFTVHSIDHFDDWTDITLDQKIKSNQSIIFYSNDERLEVYYFGDVVDKVIENSAYSLKIITDIVLNINSNLSISSTQFTEDITYILNEDEIILFFDTPLSENISYNFFINNLETCTGSKLHTIKIDYEKDTASPEFLGGEWTTPRTLLLLFSEPIKNDIMKSHFSFQEEVIIDEIGVSNDYVEIFFQEDCWYETLNLTIKKGIKDLHNNITLRDTTCVIKELYNPQIHDLIFTEIFADPTPSYGLPIGEAIEVYNNSSDTLSLMTFLLLIEDDSIALSDFNLAPQEYVILVPNNELEIWSDYQNVVGVKNWSVLNNNGENLRLINRYSSEIIDEVEYNLETYQHEQKKRGGYTLERIDLSFFCDPSINWTSSLNSFGGTFGKQNSTFELIKDTIPPLIESVSVINAQTIRISFNEKVYIDSLQNAIHYSINNVDNSVSNCFFVDKYTLEVVKNEGFPSGVLVTINVDNFYDCFNNINLSNSAEFVIKPKVNYQQLLITELMIDHSPINRLPDSEYIELYNNSDSYINTSTCTVLLDRDTLVLNEYWILPRSYLVLTPSSKSKEFDSLDIEVLGVSNWQALKNTNGKVSILNSDNELIHAVSYSKEFYKDKGKDEGGWSIEMRDIESPCIGIHNWQASENEKGGTPGKENSIKEVVVDNFSPNIDFAIYNQEDQILIIKFSEVVTPLSSFNVVVDGNLWSLNDYEFIDQYLKITVPFHSNYTDLKVNGVTDCSGNVLIEGDDIPILMKATTSSLKISEILYDPSIYNTDFVELYFNGKEKYINLKDWSIARFNNGELTEHKALSEDDHYLFQSSFIVFTKEKDVLLDQYPKAYREQIFTLSLPSFVNEKGGVALLYKGELQEYFQYNDQLHQSYLTDTEDISLERIDFDREAHQNENWTSATESSGFATPTSINSREKKTNPSGNLQGLSFSTSIITADMDGQDDYLLLENNSGETIRVIRLEVYDIKGALVYNWVYNYEIADGDFLKWEGVNKDGERVLGKYLVYLEVRNTDGIIDRYSSIVSVAPWN